MKRICSIALLAMIVLAWAGQAWAQGAPGRGGAAGDVKLGVRYTDELRGFSVCPPLDVQRIRVSSSRRLVGWVRRDDKTGAIRWSVEVLRVRQKPTTLGPSDYAKVIAAELGKNNNFAVDDTRVGVVAGKSAMHFRGIWKGALRLWRRQCWVRTEPNVYLVVNIAGAETDKAKMDAVMTAMLGSLKLIDTKAVLRERAESLKRGAAAVAKLDEGRLRSLISSETQYFRITKDNRPMGFLRVGESIAREGKDTGLRVVRGVLLRGEGDAKQLIREELFATANRVNESWQRIEETADGISVSSAIKQKELLLLQVSLPGRPSESHKKQLPEAIRASYLPQALAFMAGRFIDRSTPRGFSFAVYDAGKHDFEMRTLRIVGPEPVVVDGKVVSATRLTDQMAADAPVTSLWVDAKGMTLRLQTPDGLRMDRTTRQSIVKDYAADLLRLDRLPAAVKDHHKYRPGWGH